MEFVEGSIGIVIFAQAIAPKRIREVRVAVSDAGLDADKYVHDVKPRSQFIRALREVGNDIAPGTEGILRDRIVDDKETIKFQFSQKFLEDNGVRYARAVVVSFDKATGTVDCGDSRIRDLATELVQKFSSLYLVSDITALSKRIVEKSGAKRLLLRDGVYFLPVQYGDLADKLRKVYDALGFSYYVLPVNAQTVKKDSILKIAADDIKNTVAALRAELEELKAKDKLTPRIANARLAELKDQLRQHTEVARSLQSNVSEILEAAGEAGTLVHLVGTTELEDFVSMIQRGGAVAPLIADLVIGAEPEATAVQRRALPVVEESVSTEEPVVLERRHAPAMVEA